MTRPVVEEGSLQFVWEDEEGNFLDADPQHPIVIFPERFHHVTITGKDAFDVLLKDGERPGEGFV